MKRRASKSWQVWVYYRTPEAEARGTKILARHRAECFGSGTDLTTGERDASYFVSPRSAFALAGKLRAVRGTRVDLYRTDGAKVLPSGRIVSHDDLIRGAERRRKSGAA